MPILNPSVQAQTDPNTGLPYSAQDLAAIRMASNASKGAISPLDTRFTTIGQNLNLSSEDDLNSYLDRGVTLQVGGSNEEVRAENQGAGEQLAYGLGKMGGLAATTFADGTLGTIAGLGSLLTGGSFIDNPFSNAMLDVNDKMEEALPNYYTAEAIDNPFKGIVPLTEGSANFWGDKILKNFGFALGAYGAGLVTSGLGNMALEKVMAGRTAKAITQVLQTEGRSGKEIQDILKAVQAGDRTKLDYFKNSKVVLDAINADAKAINYGSVANQWLGSIGGAVGESRIEALGNSRQFREAEIAKLQQQYGDNIPEQELAELDNRTNNYMNTTFGINMAILTLSDYTQFSDAFRSRLAKQTALLGQIDGGLETGYKAIKMSNWEKAGKLLKNPIAEGTQEQLQFATQKGSDDYYTRRYDANGKEVVNNFIDSYVKGLGEAYGTAEGWEQFATGAIIGALGMPNIPKITGQKGLIQGGVYGELQDINNQQTNTDKATADLNKAVEYFKNNDSAKDQYQNLVRIASLNEAQKKAALAGDQFEVKNIEEDKFLSQTQAFYNAGKIEDLEDFYKGLASKKGSDIRESTLVTKNDKGEVLPEPIDQFKGLTNNEIEQYFQQKSQTGLNRINTIKKLKSDIDERFATEPDVYKEQLLHYAYTIQDVDKRFYELANKIQTVTGGASSQITDKDGNVRDLPLISYDDPIEFAKFINTENGYNQFKDAIDKHLKKHPEELDLKQQAEDLIKLADRKKEFVDKYLDGLTKNGKQRMLAKMLKDITDKLEPELKKAAATKSFKEQVLAKGYSEKRLDNKSGIFIKFGDKTYTLRSINGEQVLYDPINEKVVKQFNKDTDTFEDYLLKNPNYQVLSVEEYKDYSKAQKIAKYRQAEIEALKSLISRVTEKGKEAKEKIAEKQKELDKKIKEVEDLVNSINKETLTPEFREELQGLVKNLQENIDNLKSEIADLQATREDLLKYYDEYNTLKKQLEAEQDSYININKLIDEEQQNIANQAQLAINEVTKAIADSLEKLEYYEDYYQVIQDLILNDMILRDFISSMDFNAAFNTKYPGELRKKITPKFLNEYINTVTELNPNLSNAELDKINQVLDLIDKNPSYLDDLNSLLNQRAKLIELGQSIKFNEQNLEFTEKEIKRLKEQLPLLVAKREELLAKQGAKEFQSTIKLKALDEFKKIARRRIDAFEKLVPQELADQTTKNGLQTREPGSSLDKTKEQRERENMKKGTWSSTTGVVIQYIKDKITGLYEDKLNEDKNSPEYGLPLFTDKKAQLVWAKFLDDNSKELASGNYTLEFHLHDSNGTSALDKQITANIPADKVDAGNDIYAVIIDKAGKPVTVSGQYLFTGIHKVDTLFPENGSLRLIRENAVIGEKDPGLGNYLDGISPATAIKVKYQDKSKTIAEWQKEGIWDDVLAARKKEIFAQEKESFSNFREGIKARLNKGEKVTSEIKSVSDGIPYLDKTLKSAKSFIGDDFTLDYDTTGTFIATTKDGQKIPIEGGKLTDNDVNTVIEILKYAFPKGEDYFNGTIKLPKGKDGKQLTYQGEDFLDIFPTGSGKPSVLGSLIYYGRNKEGSKKFNIWGKGTSIQFVDEAGTTHIITRADLYKPTSQGYLDLQSFLGTKNLNFNRAFIKNGLYFQPIVKDGKLDFKIYKNYNEFVKEKAKTYLHKTTDEQPLFTNRYITYSTNTTEKPKQEPKKVVKAAPASTGGNTSIEDLAEQMAGDTDFMEAMNELKEGVVEGPMMDAGAFGLDAIISKKEEKKVETKEEPKEKKPSKLNVTRKPKGKERVVTLTNEDALKRLRELVQSGEVEKKCS